MKGDSWVAIWTVYIMVMLQVSYWMGNDLQPWVDTLEVTLGGYVIHGTVTKAVSHWRKRGTVTPGE